MKGGGVIIDDVDVDIENSYLNGTSKILKYLK